MSETITSLQGALAGESQAHVKYKYFAKIARAEGHEDIAKHFEHTADQEILHAWGHLELLIGKPTTKECLEKAIEGETQEFTVMYPNMEADAMMEGANEVAQEMRGNIAESKEHAEQFKVILDKAQKRFSALKRVEERHAAAYRDKLNSVTFPVI
jgi:rubrerythrin